GVGDAEVRAGDRDGGGEELASQVFPGGHREPAWLVGEIRRCVGHLGEEDSAQLGAVAVDRRYQDVGGLVVREMNDQFGEIGFHGGDLVFLEVLVQADL